MGKVNYWENDQLFPIEVPFPQPENYKFTFIDLFAGIGGFHLAMEELGGKCVFASEIDPDAITTYEQNIGMTPAGDITKIAATDIPPHDVLCAGFPCQPFSKAGKQEGFEDETKGTLFFDIERILLHHHTKYIILENVRNLVSHDNGNTFTLKKLIFSAVFCHLSIFFFLEKSTLQSKTRCYLVLKITSNKIRLCLITTNIITELLSNC